MSRTGRDRRGPVTRVDCDVVIIGSGAGGSVAARELAAAGRTVTVLEEGPRVTVGDISAGTPAENLRRLYRHGGLTPIFGRPMVAYGEGRCVGGTTVVNGGLLWAPPEALLDRWADESGIKDFRASRLNGHLDAISERLGVIAQPDGAGNRDSVLLSVGADRLGWRWQAAHRAVRGCRHNNLCVTGCPAGAKQSMAETYLPDAERLGAQVLPGFRALRLKHDGRNIQEVQVADVTGRRWAYRPREVFLAAGPIGSAVLLQRSRIRPGVAGRRMAFHVNLRTIARFPERVAAEQGTLFTRQVHELGDRGVLMMPSNVTAGSLGAAIAGKPPEMVRPLLDDIDRLGIYTTQVRMQGSIRITTLPFGNVVLRHGMTRADQYALRSAFRQTARVLFAAGASELYPPVPGALSLRDEADADLFVSQVRDADWELVSVHGMASCAIGLPERDGVCDERGRPYGFQNLRLCDGSVLPGVTGISPQGTIMAFAHEIVSKFLAP